MKNVIEESYNFLINKWASTEYKGRGSIHCVKPLDYSEIVCRIITQMRNKNPTAKVFIAEEDNDTYYRRENIYNDNFWA